MKQLGIFFLILFFISCKRDRKKHLLLPPETRVVNYDSALKKTDAGWVYKGEPFSGYMIETETDDKLVYQLPVIAGREQGLARAWYNTGEKLMERNFVDGKKEGRFIQWWPNGNTRYLFNYRNDLYEGEQTVFYPDGKKRQVSHYHSGEPEGLQSFWDEEGLLVSNYTIKNKKLYGVMSMQSCIPPFH